MNVSVNLLIDQDVNFNVWLSDQEMLFNRLRNREVGAFKILYNQYAAAVYGTIIRKITDEKMAKSILNETFCEVWQSFASYDATKLRIFSWINQIAMRNIRKTTV